MSYYLCGHDRKPIFLTNNIISLMRVMTRWEVWKCTTGFEGDKTQCFKCYCRTTKAEPSEEVKE